MSQADSEFREILLHDLPPFDQTLERANLAPLAEAADNR